MTDERDNATKTKDGRKKWNWRPSPHDEERRRRLAEEQRWLELNSPVVSRTASEQEIQELLEGQDDDHS
jgi:hypothetical protein